MKDLEHLIVLLLGSERGPIPSAEHLQKEAFVLSQVNPELSALLRFKRHCNGPHSARLQEASMDTARRDHSYEVKADGRIEMTARGKERYGAMVGDGPRGGHDDLAIAASMIRHMYDRLTVDELRLLICDTYPAYTSRSNGRYWYKDPDTRRRIAMSLVEKEIITQGRFKELTSSA